MLSIKKQILLERDRFLYNRRKRDHRLQQLFWECTLKCNLSCQHCGSDCKTSSVQPDMPLGDFLPVLDEIKQKASPENILIITTGGEPLVRQDIIDCGKAITERGFSWGMVSNGMLLDIEMARRLASAGLRTIAISLDGFEEDHNWMRGHSQSFQRAVTAIKALRGVNDEGIPLTWDVITCVNRRNIDGLDEFKNFLISIGVRQWRIFTVFPAGRATQNDDLILDNADTRRVMDFIARTRKEGDISLSYSCEGFLGEYEYEVRDYSYFCQAGVNVASILSDGSISGCLSIRSNYNQGNIYKDSFWDVWENRFAQYRDRKWLRKGQCKDCEMWRYCEGNGMHLRDDYGNLIHCNLSKMT